MANQQAIDKILNKQFKKTAFAGYDTQDVDSFFDVVIDYLKANDSAMAEFKAQLDKAITTNHDLAEKIKQLQQLISQYKQTIAQYEQAGYGNVMMNKRMTDMEQEIKQLKKDKNNGKQ